MKASILLLVIVAGILAMAHADPSGRFIEDCSKTQMRITNRRRFVGGDVYKSVLLSAGQGTTYCADLCRIDSQCWSFNFSKNSKLCFLQTSAEDVPTQRKITWSSGYRECLATESAWNNPSVDSVNDAVTGLTVGVGGSAGEAKLDWVDPVNKASYVATFVGVCVSPGGSCSDTPLGTVPAAVAEGLKTVTVTGLGAGTAVDCYVRTLVGGEILACSAVASGNAA